MTFGPFPILFVKKSVAPPRQDAPNAILDRLQVDVNLTRASGVFQNRPHGRLPADADENDRGPETEDGTTCLDFRKSKKEKKKKYNCS
jgi:hypothetical protein